MTRPVAWQIVDKKGKPVDWLKLELDRYYQINPEQNVKLADQIEKHGAPHRARPLVYGDE